MTNCPFAGFFLLTSSTLHCIAYWFPQTASPLHASEQYLQKDVRLLLQFAESWSIAHTFCSNLSQLYSLCMCARGRRWRSIFVSDGSACESQGLSQSKESRDQTRAGVLSLLASHRNSPVEPANKTPTSADSKHNLFQLLNAAKLSSPLPLDPTLSPAPRQLPLSAAPLMPYIDSPDLQLAQDLFGLSSPQFPDMYGAPSPGYSSQTPMDDGSWSHFAFSQNPWPYAYMAQS
jgi:hypothetical protein